MQLSTVAELLNSGCKAHNLIDNEIADVDYYLTPPGDGKVKLGVRYTMHNGETYGNIIEIPFNTLCTLTDKAKNNGRDTVGTRTS